MIRQILRNIARNNMEVAGVTKINKHMRSNKRTGWAGWREYLKKGKYFLRASRRRSFAK